jgi:hypothetical protein
MIFMGCRPCGPPGPQDPAGAETRYFFNQTRVGMGITDIGVFVSVIQTVVTTTIPGERVRLDSMIEVLIGTDVTDSYSFAMDFRIVRDIVTELTRITYSQLNVQKWKRKVEILYSYFPFYYIAVGRVPPCQN